ncbi:MAG TPA: hypothetical protein VGT44_10265, partial [Ktedonobacteraceae bacterium]|nr:hypothetical protein [Ktedonobacteraceae bacterium]
FQNAPPRRVGDRFIGFLHGHGSASFHIFSISGYVEMLARIWGIVKMARAIWSLLWLSLTIYLTVTEKVIE